MPCGKLEPLRSSSSGKSGRTSSTRGGIELILFPKRRGNRQRTSVRDVLDQRDLGRLTNLPCILRCATAGEKAATVRRVERLAENVIDRLRTDKPSTCCQPVGTPLETTERTPMPS